MPDGYSFFDRFRATQNDDIPSATEGRTAESERIRKEKEMMRSQTQQFSTISKLGDYFLDDSTPRGFKKQFEQIKENEEKTLTKLSGIEKNIVDLRDKTILETQKITKELSTINSSMGLLKTQIDRSQDKIISAISQFTQRFGNVSSSLQSNVNMANLPIGTVHSGEYVISQNLLRTEQGGFAAQQMQALSNNERDKQQKLLAYQANKQGLDSFRSGGFTSIPQSKISNIVETKYFEELDNKVIQKLKDDTSKAYGKILKTYLANGDFGLPQQVQLEHIHKSVLDDQSKAAILDTFKKHIGYDKDRLLPEIRRLVDNRYIIDYRNDRTKNAIDNIFPDLNHKKISEYLEKDPSGILQDLGISKNKSRNIYDQLIKYAIDEQGVQEKEKHLDTRFVNRYKSLTAKLGIKFIPVDNIIEGFSRLFGSPTDYYGERTENELQKIQGGFKDTFGKLRQFSLKFKDVPRGTTFIPRDPRDISRDEIDHRITEKFDKIMTKIEKHAKTHKLYLSSPTLEQDTIRKIKNLEEQQRGKYINVDSLLQPLAGEQPTRFINKRKRELESYNRNYLKYLGIHLDEDYKEIKEDVNNLNAGFTGKRAEERRRLLEKRLNKLNNKVDKIYDKLFHMPFYKNLREFSLGGYTGGYEPDNIQGVVHEGEYVIPKFVLDKHKGIAESAEKIRLKMLGVEEELSPYALGGFVEPLGASDFNSFTTQSFRDSIGQFLSNISGLLGDIRFELTDTKESQREIYNIQKFLYDEYMEEKHQQVGEAWIGDIGGVGGQAAQGSKMGLGDWIKGGIGFGAGSAIFKKLAQGKLQGAQGLKTIGSLLLSQTPQALTIGVPALLYWFALQYLEDLEYDERTEIGFDPEEFKRNLDEITDETDPEKMSELIFGTHARDIFVTLEPLSMLDPETFLHDLAMEGGDQFFSLGTGKRFLISEQIENLKTIKEILQDRGLTTHSQLVGNLITDLQDYEEKRDQYRENPTEELYGELESSFLNLQDTLKLIFQRVEDTEEPPDQLPEPKIDITTGLEQGLGQSFVREGQERATVLQPDALARRTETGIQEIVSAYEQVRTRQHSLKENIINELNNIDITVTDEELQESFDEVIQRFISVSSAVESSIMTSIDWLQIFKENKDDRDARIQSIILELHKIYPDEDPEVIKQWQIETDDKNMERFNNWLRDNLDNLQPYFDQFSSGLEGYQTLWLESFSKHQDDKETRIGEIINNLEILYPDKTKDEIRQLQEEIDFQNKTLFNNWVKSNIDNVQPYFDSYTKGLEQYQDTWIKIYTENIDNRDKQINEIIKELKVKYPDLTDEQLFIKQSEVYEQSKIAVDNFQNENTDLYAAYTHNYYTGLNISLEKWVSIYTENIGDREKTIQQTVEELKTLDLPLNEEELYEMQVKIYDTNINTIRFFTNANVDNIRNMFVQFETGVRLNQEQYFNIFDENILDRNERLRAIAIKLQEDFQEFELTDEQLEYLQQGIDTEIQDSLNKNLQSFLHDKYDIVVDKQDEGNKKFYNDLLSILGSVNEGNQKQVEQKLDVLRVDPYYDEKWQEFEQLLQVSRLSSDDLEEFFGGVSDDIESGITHTANQNILYLKTLEQINKDRETMITSIAHTLAGGEEKFNLLSPIQREQLLSLSENYFDESLGDIADWYSTAITVTKEKSLTLADSLSTFQDLVNTNVIFVSDEVNKLLKDMDIKWEEMSPEEIENLILELENQTKDTSENKLTAFFKKSYDLAREALFQVTDFISNIFKTTDEYVPKFFGIIPRVETKPDGSVSFGALPSTETISPPVGYQSLTPGASIGIGGGGGHIPLMFSPFNIFDRGGYTSNTLESNQIQGIVHQNEYVIPEDIVDRYPSIVDRIEQHRTGRISSKDFIADLMLESAKLIIDENGDFQSVSSPDFRNIVEMVSKQKDKEETMTQKQIDILNEILKAILQNKKVTIDNEELNIEGMEDLKKLLAENKINGSDQYNMMFNMGSVNPVEIQQLRAASRRGTDNRTTRNLEITVPLQ